MPERISNDLQKGTQIFWAVGCTCARADFRKLSEY